MKKIFLIITCLFIAHLTMTAQGVSVKPKPIVKTTKTVTKAKKKPVKIAQLLKETVIAKDTMDFNNTGIKIYLDSLTSEIPFDTLIKKGRRIIRYSFTPMVNTWAITDTSYKRRYSFNINVEQILTDKPDDIIDKNVLILNKEIAEDQQRIQDKIRARNEALKLKNKN